MQVALAVAGPALGLERGTVGAFFEGMPRIEGIVGVADRAEKEIVIECHAVRGMHVGVGADERRLGVEHQAGEIKDERADHGWSRIGPMGLMGPIMEASNYRPWVSTSQTSEARAAAPRWSSRG